MKTARLIGIITMLQQRGKMTAKELAERFEVSRRTIIRDVVDICQAGIPLVTEQGQGGGISLAPGFALDTTVFTREEMATVLAGLRTLDSVSRRGQAALLSQKLGGAEERPESLSIDLGSFYRDSLTDKLELLQCAIRDRRTVTFRYYAPGGEGLRTVDPLRIVYRWSAWYVQGYCHDRQDFRLFKLLRLWELTTTEEQYVPREVPEERQRLGSHMTDDYMITAVYDASCKYRLVEEYGPDSFRVLPDGRVEAKWGFTDLEQAVSWFLSFGNRVKVTDPPEFVQKMRETAEGIFGMYDEI